MGDISPISPASINMQGLGLPLQGFAHYATPSQALDATQGIDDLNNFANGYDQQGYVQTQGPQSMMLAQFIMEDKSEPWSTLRMNAAPIPASNQPAVIPQIQPSYNFGTYRVPPSEADTFNHSVAGVASDSGYGSMARQSVDNRSVCNGEVDQSAETQSLISQLQGLSGPVQEEPQKLEARGQKPPSGKTNTGSWVCDECGIRVGTPSELK